MKRQLCKIFTLVFSIMLVFSSAFAVPSQAATATDDFSVKTLDKAYITFLFDDGRMPFTKDCFEVFKRYNMPMCCDVVADRVQKDQTIIDLLLDIQAAGGEIFSHTLTHNAITADTSTVKNIEKEFGDSYRLLTHLGFEINGIIETGNGGGEKTAKYDVMEPIVRKYYKYSNAYGLSKQYKWSRTWLSGKSLDTVKNLVNDAINNKKHLTLWAHDFSEFSKSDMEDLLDYIDGRGKSKVEVVTWKYVYDNFGTYTGAQIPSAEVTASVCTAHGHKLKNATVATPATCEKGPVMKGVCERCGKNGTVQSETGALGHKFGKYVSDNNATCTSLSTETAKCTNKGCTATDTRTDFNSEWKHNFKTVVVKEATADADGLAEKQCTLCGRIEEKIVIPKGKDVDDVVSSETSNNDSSDSDDNSEQVDSDTSSDNASSSTVSGNKDNSSKKDGKTSSGSKSADKTGLIVILAVILVFLFAAIGVFVWLIVKKGKA